MEVTITIPELPEGYRSLGFRLHGSLDKEKCLILDPMCKWIIPGCRGGYYIWAYKD